MRWAAVRPPKPAPTITTLGLGLPFFEIGTAFMDSALALLWSHYRDSQNGGLEQKLLMPHPLVFASTSTLKFGCFGNARFCWLHRPASAYTASSACLITTYLMTA